MIILKINAKKLIKRQLFALVIVIILACVVQVVLSNENEQHANNVSSEKAITYNTYESLDSSESVHQSWDISSNLLDLQTGEVTIDLTIKETWSEDKILYNLKGLSQQVLLENKQASSVKIVASTGNEQYVYQSDKPNTIGKTH